MDSNKLEEADERFCIMSTQPDVNQETIKKYILENYGEEITNSIFAKYKKIALNSPYIDDMKPESPQMTNNPTSPENTPKNVNLEQLATFKPDMDMLLKYISAGIELIPTIKNEAGGFAQLKKDKGTPQEKIIKIDSFNSLEFWINHNIERFIFIPKTAGLLCFDIDKNHGDNINGLANFTTWLKNNELSEIPYFRDIENGSFPTYTTTPRGGIHLYFKCTAELKTLSVLIPGVEIKYNGLNLTAGGSARADGLYKLYGELENAPILPAPLLLKLSKDLNQPKPQIKTSNYTNQAKKKGYTTAQLLDFVRKDNPGLKGHAIIFEMAKRLYTAGIPLEEALEAIQQTPEHLTRNDKADTENCIKSKYRSY